MDVAAISAQQLALIQAQASVLVLRQALDLQATLAQQLLEALPPVASGPRPGASLGGQVDTYA